VQKQIWEACKRLWQAVTDWGIAKAGLGNQKQRSSRINIGFWQAELDLVQAATDLEKQ
jgi:hypothetical protein